MVFSDIHYQSSDLTFCPKIIVCKQLCRDFTQIVIQGQGTEGTPLAAFTYLVFFLVGCEKLVELKGIFNHLMPCSVDSVNGGSTIEPQTDPGKKCPKLCFYVGLIETKERYGNAVQEKAGGLSSTSSCIFSTEAFWSVVDHSKNQLIVA